MKYSFVQILEKFVTSISAGSPASPVVGQIWYDSVLDKFRGKKESVEVDLEAGSGGGPGGTQNVFIQDTEPTVTVESLWIDTTNGNYEFYIKTP